MTRAALHQRRAHAAQAEPHIVGRGELAELHAAGGLVRIVVEHQDELLASAGVQIESGAQSPCRGDADGADRVLQQRLECGADLGVVQHMSHVEAEEPGLKAKRILLIVEHPAERALRQHRAGQLDESGNASRREIGDGDGIAVSRAVFDAKTGAIDLRKTSGFYETAAGAKLPRTAWRYTDVQFRAPLVAALGLVQRVERLVPREDEVGLAAHLQLRAADAAALERVDLLEQRGQVDHHAVPDDRNDVRVQHAARDELQRVPLGAHHHRVTGVVATLITDDMAVLGGEQVDDLGLALVAPLGAYDNSDGKWLVNPMFIEPKSRADAPYRCSTDAYTDAAGAKGAVTRADGSVIPDQADTVA
mgnify:CR=1 FL=1